LYERESGIWQGLNKLGGADKRMAGVVTGDAKMVTAGTRTQFISLSTQNVH